MLSLREISVGSPKLGQVLLGAIGPTTAAALREAGLTAGAVPAEHTAEGLADALADALGG